FVWCRSWGRRAIFGGENQRCPLPLWFSKRAAAISSVARPAADEFIPGDQLPDRLLEERSPKERLPEERPPAEGVRRQSPAAELPVSIPDAEGRAPVWLACSRPAISVGWMLAPSPSPPSMPK